MRGKKAKKRQVESDPLYKSRMVARFINYIMLDGKKSKARNVIYGMLEGLAEDKKEAIKKQVMLSTEISETEYNNLTMNERLKIFQAINEVNGLMDFQNPK